MKEDKLEVFLDGRLVGTLGETSDHRAAFAYADGWLNDGFAVSPFSLPLEEKVFIPDRSRFHGLWGVFADSLPDAWGQLLLDRMLRRRGVRLEDISVLERLAIVGSSGMGALTYHPAWDTARDAALGDLDDLAARCHAMLNQEDISDPDELFRLGGSSGGARPKVMTKEWIIKFPASRDMRDSGRMEKDYMDCAAECGIAVPETRLLPSRQCGGYYAVRRFDRAGGVRKHMLSASAILEKDWRTATMDYSTLMKLTDILSRSNSVDILQMYRRMCFNVFAHNRDDHARNFSWIYDPQNDCWHPSPAYDLTWSTTYFGEHTTTVNGEGKNPGLQDLIAVGRQAGLSAGVCESVAEEIREKTRPLEEKYRDMRS